MSTKKKVAAIVITTVALTAGTVGISSAASKSATRVSTTRTTAGVAMVQGHGAEVASVLAALVTKGTITQAQADAITAALAAAETAEHANDPQGGPKGAPGIGMPDPTAALSLISSTIGVDAATIQKRLAAGESLAAIAGAKKDALIAALVAEETKRIDAAVTAGKLTAAQATTLKSTLTAHVTDEVNSTRPMGPMGGGKGGKGERGHGGPMGGKPSGPMGSPTLTLPATPKA
jgi:polyhydroxyalkanoate synthesis regulator phasin